MRGRLRMVASPDLIVPLSEEGVGQSGAFQIGVTMA